MKEWKSININGFKDYMISNKGDVKSFKVDKKGRDLKPSISSSGYKMVNLTKEYNQKTYNIHQLMAFAFLNHSNKDKKTVVDHINNVKTDNRLENLQIISARLNTSKNKKEGSSKYIGVSFCKQTNKWRSVIKIGAKNKHLGRFNTEYEAHLAYQEKLKKIQNE